MTDTKAGSCGTEPQLSAPAERFDSGWSRQPPPAVGHRQHLPPNPAGAYFSGCKCRCTGKGFVSPRIGGELGCEMLPTPHTKALLPATARGDPQDQGRAFAPPTLLFPCNDGTFPSPDVPVMFLQCRGEQPENAVQAAPREAAVAGKADALTSAQATLITTTLYKKSCPDFFPFGALVLRA